MHEKILLNLPKLDLISGIVFESNFDHYLGLIPIQINKIIIKNFLRQKTNKPRIEVDKHLQVSLLE